MRGFLRELRETEGLVAVVGLSCHMHGLFNALERFPELKHKIAFSVGLISPSDM
ncbi:MAG: hypothetical protein ACOCSE_01685 [Chitinivibrionales bacterium]